MMGIGMSLAGILFILLLAVPLALIIGIVLIVLNRLLRANGSKKGKMDREQETRLIQEMHQALSKMEERIEALETIVIDRERKQEEP